MRSAVALRGSMTEVLPASPRDVFALVTDLDRLPEWNAIITGVVDRPATLGPDAEWVVELKAMGNRWRSRSRVLELDARAMRFAYRSRTDDGNPSYGEWTWVVAEDAGGSKVTVSWDLYPETFWRRTLLARVRNRQLRREVRNSLRALARCSVGGVDAR
jgi:uncharacterized protein YndB with AHSA1/START domain